MALNIPLPKPPGEGLTEGLNIGSQMMARFIQSQVAQQEQDRLGQMTPYEIALKQAQASEANANVKNNPLKMDLLRAQIDATKALGNQRNMGVGGAGAGMKEMYGLVRQIVSDNPGMDITQANQVASAYLSGSTTLPDGSPVPQASGITQQLLNQVTKRGSTSTLITQGVQSNQAEAENQEFSKYTNMWLKPYGTTYFNKSPAQIMDTFKDDDASQTRLGEFIAGQRLQNDLVESETRISQGSPSVTNTAERIKNSGQVIDAEWPRLSQKARQVAQERYIWALNQGLRARQRVGVGAANAGALHATGAMPRAATYTPAQLQAFAADAIAKGADPKAVQAEMAKLTGGG